jgi:hypothetical protein
VWCTTPARERARRKAANQAVHFRFRARGNSTLPRAGYDRNRNEAALAADLGHNYFNSWLRDSLNDYRYDLFKNTCMERATSYQFN